MSKFWERLSGREQKLAMITVGVMVLAVCSGVAWHGAGVLDDLDSRIDQLEQNLLNMVQQDARRVSVDRAFLKVAAAHSSEWTEQEIHDRLRREVYRLALTDPPAEDSEVLSTNVSKRDYMVQIPRLREGTLKEEGDGYREYQISLRLPGTAFTNILTFLERLQSSRQMLRIDALELARAPQSTTIEASIDVTRTVLDNPDDEGKVLTPWSNLAVNPSFEEWDDAAQRFGGWEVRGCEVSREDQYATAGAWCLSGFSQKAGGQVFQVLELECGRRYKLQVDITSFSPLWLSVEERGRRSSSVLGTRTRADGLEAAVEGQAIAGGCLELVGDGETYRYELDFTPRGSFGERREILAPLIEAPAKGTRFFVDRVMLTMYEE